MKTRLLLASLMVLPLAISTGNAKSTEGDDASLPAPIVELQPLLHKAASQDANIKAPKSLDGYRMKTPYDPAIFLIMFQQRRHIPNPETYNNLFKSTCVTYDEPLLDLIDAGPALDDGAKLLVGLSSKAVYLFTDSLKYHVSNPSVMARYCFDYSKAIPVDDELLAFIPDGPPLT